ncbi:MAG: hypothetical protein GF311_18895 [Candidatus Lokiarchaeota archaeon]|nr:hypothetical protein [Candidatus Lokiarchaeota archaeon]
MIEDKLPQEIYGIIDLLKKTSKITGYHFNFNQFLKRKEKIIPIANCLKHFLKFIYNILKMGEGIELEMEPSKLEHITIKDFFLLSLPLYLSELLNNPEKFDAFKGVIEFFVQTVFIPSFQISYETISIPRGDPFEEQIRARFKKAFDRALIKNGRAIVKLFFELQKSIAYEEKLLDLLRFSSYNKLGIESHDNEKITIIEFLEFIYNKIEKLLNLQDNEIKDIISEFIRRFNTLIESYFKLILAAIMNLEKIIDNEKFISFHNSLGFFARSLKLDRIYLGNYLDLRNSISHRDFIVDKIDRIQNQIEIKFTFRRFNKEGQETSSKTQIYTFSEIIDKFKILKAFSNVFLGFLKAYIVNYFLIKEGKDYSELVTELRTLLDNEFKDKNRIRQEINNFLDKLKG